MSEVDDRKIAELKATLFALQAAVKSVELIAALQGMKLTVTSAVPISQSIEVTPEGGLKATGDVMKCVLYIPPALLELFARTQDAQRTVKLDELRRSIADLEKPAPQS